MDKKNTVLVSVSVGMGISQDVVRGFRKGVGVGQGGSPPPQ
jgi:hypothetical protein